MATYNERTSIKKIVFPNGISLDLFPDFQETLYRYRQIGGNIPEAGGILIGYENEETKNITVINGTKPKTTDFRSRARLVLRAQHSIELNNLEEPYGYIGTWHTHPTEIPRPSLIDVWDWRKSIKENKNATDSLVFIIGGTCTFRVWLCDSTTKEIIEGKEI